MGSMKTIFAYLLFTMIVIGLFLYVQFPAAEVKAYLDGRIAAIDPELSLSMKTLSPSLLPPGMKATDANLSRGEQKLVQIPRASVSPVLRSLLRKDRKVTFEMDLAGGRIDGQAVMDNRKKTGQIQLAVDFSHLQLEQIDALKTNDRFALSGIGDGDVTYQGPLSGAGKTNSTFTITDLRITLSQEFFGIDELLMGQAEGTLSGSGPLYRVNSLTFDGPMAEGKITGTLEVRKPFGNSQLNLTGNAKPRPELIARLQGMIPEGFLDVRSLGARGLNFRIRGSVESPEANLR